MGRKSTVPITLKLLRDSGPSATDKIISGHSLTVTVAAGALIRFMLDGGTIGSAFTAFR